MNMMDVMNLPLLENARIVAGKQGMGRFVESVNMMDAPDIIHFLKPNELLLTTAFGMKESTNELLALVQQMAAKGCAGLGIKTKRFITDIPQSVIDGADELAFPVIEIPVDTPLGELSTQILGVILEKRTEELRYALDTHRKFSDLMMKGRGIQAITESLAGFIQKPVLLLNHRLRVLAESHSNQTPLFEQIYHAIKQMNKTWRGQLSGMVSFSLYSRLDHERQTVTLFPFEIYNDQQGFNVVLDMITSEDKFSVLAIEQAANVLGVDFMKQHAIEENARRIRNEFFADFLEGGISAEEEILNRGKNYGLQKMQPYQCIVL